MTAPVQEKLKIGGMALENGVMFQTERHWAMAVRHPDGDIAVASGEKLLPAPLRRMKRIPLLRGLLSLAENATTLPHAYRNGGALPLLSKSPPVMASMIVSALGTMAIRNPKKKLPPLAEELVATALALIPTLLAMRRTDAVQYHAAEHKSINAYETAGVVEASGAREARAEHRRCGSNLVGPALLLMTLGNTLTHRLPGRRHQAARLGVSVLSLSGAVEMVQWAARHPQNLWSKILTGPGSELQSLVTTSEPTNDQLQVSLAALQELLRLEGALTDPSGDLPEIT
ncbi:MAG: DUF1385 domain-containing protein [Thermoleophilia bacterium]